MLLIERVTEYNNRGSYETGENKKESRGDLVILELLKIFSVGIFFIYILAVGVLGIIAIIRYCRHEREKKFWFMPVISVAAGCCISAMDISLSNISNIQEWKNC